MEDRTRKVEKDDQGRETFRKTIWKCKYPNYRGRRQIPEFKFGL
jgi:hypothetical protein